VALFDDLGLPDPENFGRRFPHQVSGGQLQRAMTVMALVWGGSSSVSGRAVKNYWQRT